MHIFKNRQKMAKIGTKNSHFLAIQPLLFWESEGTSTAEVDFVKTIESKIVPIEVKAGSTGSLRSLHSFMKQKNVALGVRISEYNISLDGPILSLPFYVMRDLERFVKEELSRI